MFGKYAFLRRTLLLILAMVITSSIWLFVSNGDQLFPSKELKEQGREFAGGFWHRDDFWRSVNLSVISATMTALLAAILGIPAAYALSRYEIPGNKAIETIFSAIIVFPASSVGLALIVMFQYGPLRKFQDWLGFDFMYSIFPGVILAQGVLALAIGMSAWRGAFDAVSARYETIARTLGANSWQAFYKVTLPLAWPGLLAGFILAWVRAIAEFGAVLLFCGTFRELPSSHFSSLAKLFHVQKADLLSIAMWSEIEYGNVEYGIAIAFSLAFVSGFCVFLFHRLGGRGFVWR